MEDWVHRALEKWPNVPALFGWLALDRRGRWLIKGEIISRPQIIDTINPNYACDEHGRWYFQNGPQRGYVTLEATPLILRVDGGGRLGTHTGQLVGEAKMAYLDEAGALILETPLGAGLLDAADLEWALPRLLVDDHPADEDQLGRALSLASGQSTALRLRIGEAQLPVVRMDTGDLPQRLGFVRDPHPLPGEALPGTAAAA